MGKALIVVGAVATLAVGMLAADPAIGGGYKPSDNTWMVGRNDDTTPCREASRLGYSGGSSHTDWIYQLAEACRQESRRAHGTYRIPDSYRGPSRKPRGEGSEWFYTNLP